jgi:preprotein translocase subunit SecG
VTGITLVLGEPIRELMSLSFWLKMGLLAIGITSAVAFKRSLGPAVLGGSEPAFSSAAKSAAMATVVLWLAIIFLGRAIAYDVEVWGALSLSPRA